MKTRPIDANQLYRIEKLLDTDIVKKDKVASELLEQVLYDIQHMPTLTPPNEWLSVEERLPEKGENVLVYAIAKYIGDTKIGIDKLEEGERRPVWFYTHGWFEVTHWMPLPEAPDSRPPEGEEDT